MEEPIPHQPSTDVEPRNGRRRRTQHHHPLHLHRSQRRFLARAGVFVVLLVIMLIVWYWMAGRS